MSSAGRAKSKPRESYQLCAQRIACASSREKATFYCKDCDCVQCTECISAVHQSPNTLFHRPPVAIPATDPRLLCSKGSCDYLADFNCLTCKKNYCCKCDAEFHGRIEKAYHKKTPFILPPPVEPPEPEDQFFSLADSDTMMQQMPNPDIILNTEGSPPVISSSDYPTSPIQDAASFHLVDNTETLQVSSEEEFIEKLGCKPGTLIKVVSIFGNTGDGKSHTLNHSFFGGREVFKTSPSQDSCTMGVWAAFDPVHSIILLDTEGFLGKTSSETKRHRLLLKILAVSDVVVYRTMARRLTTDLYHFLGLASRIFRQHFSQELELVAQQHSITNLSSLGPSVVIFHETNNTEPLKSDGVKRPEDKLAEAFQTENQKIDAFSQLEYVGIQTKEPPTDFQPFVSCMERHLENMRLRMARPPEAVFQAIKTLNRKFSKDIDSPTLQDTSILDALFQCRQTCITCNAQCIKNDNHKDDHSSLTLCTFHHSYKNEIFLCEKCYKNQRRTVLDYQTWQSDENPVLGSLNYLLSGSVLECPVCGPIYRSHGSWFRHPEPWEMGVVRKETVHVWSEPTQTLPVTHNAGRKIVDAVEGIYSTIADASKVPATYICSMTAEGVRPASWQPDEEIKECALCQNKLELGEIHHCRVCGKGVCQGCSPKKRLIEKWKFPVRVCLKCDKAEINTEQISDDITYRQLGEVLHLGVTTVGSAVQTTLGVVAGVCVRMANPSYWQPDAEAKFCNVCKNEFSEKLKKHHCRKCGMVVCDGCSQFREPVPEHNFHDNVRVCKTCHESSSS